MLLSTILLVGLLTTPEKHIPDPPKNGRCPVLKNPVGDRNQTVTVRGKRYYICCAECEEELKRNPDKYLNADGTLKRSPSGTDGYQVRDHY